LQSVTLPSGHVVSYVYDGSNRRVGKKIDGVLQQGFLYRDAIKPVVELDGAGNVVSRFVYGTNPITPDYVIKGGNTYKIFADQIGSPRVVVDVSSGSVVERIDYDERGNTLQDTNAGFIPFGFAGGIVDRDTGLLRFGARDYDPSVGRWTEKDSIGFDGGTNFYVYAGSDGINRIDPTGHYVQALVGAAVAAGADLGWQLYRNGGNLSCVSWGEVAGAGLVGAVIGLVGPAALDAFEVGGEVEPWLAKPITGVTTEETTFFRTWGGDSGQVGRWLSPSLPDSAAAARSELALPAGNTAEFTSTVTVPAGTQFEIGQAAEAFGQPGGGIQIRLIGDLDPSWFGPGIPVE
jgi:RHS repeat-associated protein